MSEINPNAQDVYSGSLGPKFRAILPKPVREALAVKEGDTLLYLVQNGEVTLTTRNRLARQLAGSFRRDDGRNLTDELIADRRAEAERDL